MGRTLAPLLRARLAASEDPINVITFENHRRAPELLAARLIEEDPFLAPTICRTVGIGGAAVWRTIPHRTITSRGIRFDVEGADECYADALALIPGVPPLDDSVPGIELVRAFDDRMIEKLWIFNAGHAAAAYLGWQYGCRTIREAMEHQPVRAAVAGVVTEAQRAVEAYLGRRPGSVPLPPRSSNWILDSYANPRLDDPIVRVAREPRRKLGADDRLIGPGIACLAAGFRPLALADAMAAALGYAEPNDPQATDLQREIDHGLFPILATEYAGLSTAQAGLIYSLSAVVFLIAGPFYGWITDRYGRLVGIASRSAANIGSSVMYMVSPTFVGMAAARSVDNIGKAAFRPAWASAITDIAAKDPPRKGRRLGTLDAMQEIGQSMPARLWPAYSGRPAVCSLCSGYASRSRSSPRSPRSSSSVNCRTIGRGSES